MTLVLQFGGDQISNNSLFSVSGSGQNSSMPCVFDNDSFQQEIESAFMRDWASPISDYSMPAEDSTMNTPSDALDLKRKPDDSGDVLDHQSKKIRVEEEDSTPPPSDQANDPSSRTSSSNISSDNDSNRTNNTSTISCTQFFDLLEVTLNSTAVSPTSSSSESPEEEEEFPMPRRRGLQMWNSRQRWKDERKRVLKMSVAKLTEIEDPELCLLRSVLINNTVKKLHSDIRNERQAKIRHRQMRMDSFSSPHIPEEITTSTSISNQHLYDDSSCDEIFSEDLSGSSNNVPVVDRRVSSPIPMVSSTTDSELPEPMDVSPSTSQPSASTTPCFSRDSSCDTSNSEQLSERRPLAPANVSTPKRPNQTQSAMDTTVSGQCATQYRAARDVSFPPRVPILDSVVYHSLLASLQSS